MTYSSYAFDVLVKLVPDYSGTNFLLGTSLAGNLSDPSLDSPNADCYDVTPSGIPKETE